MANEKWQSFQNVVRAVIKQAGGLLNLKKKELKSHQNECGNNSPNRVGKGLRFWLIQHIQDDF